MATKAPARYSYVKLASLKPNTTVNVYGVVKFVKPPFRTQGSDYCMVISIIDQSLHDEDQKLRCLLFRKSKEELPYTDVGSIVRFHRLKISKFRDDMQGQSGPGFSWLVFSKEKGGSMEPKSATPNYTLADEDTKMVDELRNWIASDSGNIPDETLFSISDIVPQMYFNIYCQVVSTCSVEENVCYILRVWDGTKSIHPIRQFDFDRDHCMVKLLSSLVRRSSGLTVDIAVYDDHYKLCKGIQPGDFIKVCNLHAPIFKDKETLPEVSEIETVELCVHRGTSYGRGVFILPSNLPQVLALKDKLERIASASKETSDNVTDRGEIQSECSSAKRARTEHSSETCDNVDQSDLRTESADLLSNSNPLSSRSAQGSGDETSRCMLQTMSVVVNHPHIGRTKISEVLSHSVPYKFRILGHVEDFFPRPSEPTDIIRLYCPECHYLQRVPEFNGRKSTRSGLNSYQGLIIRKEWSHYREYLCPKCPSVDHDTVPDLLYIFVMRFRISDKSGSLIANMWKEDAVTFFNDVTPTELIQDAKLFTRIKEQLNALCDQEDRGVLPLFECCIKSYVTLEGGTTAYQIFDTCLV